MGTTNARLSAAIRFTGRWTGASIAGELRTPLDADRVHGVSIGGMGSADPSAVGLLRLGQGMRGEYETKVAEGLRKVAEKLPRRGVDLLG